MEKKFRLSDLYFLDELSPQEKTFLHGKISSYIMDIYKICYVHPPDALITDKLLHTIYDRLYLTIPENLKDKMNFSACHHALINMNYIDTGFILDNDHYNIDIYQSFYNIVKNRIRILIADYSPDRIKAVKKLQSLGCLKYIKLPDDA